MIATAGSIHIGGERATRRRVRFNFFGVGHRWRYLLRRVSPTANDI